METITIKLTEKEKEALVQTFIESAEFTKKNIIIRIMRKEKTV